MHPRIERVNLLARCVQHAQVRFTARCTAQPGLTAHGVARFCTSLRPTISGQHLECAAWSQE
jgi:hypothetical protein